MKALNLAVRFALELCALVALAEWGWHASDKLVLQLLLAVAAPLVAAAAWGAWVAPRASRRLTDPARLGVEALVFTAATAGLLATEHVTLAIALAVVYVVNVALLFVLRLREF
jgi:hypothetical protein